MCTSLCHNNCFQQFSSNPPSTSITVDMVQPVCNVCIKASSISLIEVRKECSSECKTFQILTGGNRECQELQHTRPSFLAFGEGDPFACPCMNKGMDRVCVMFVVNVDQRICGELPDAIEKFLVAPFAGLRSKVGQKVDSITESIRRVFVGCSFLKNRSRNPVVMKECEEPQQ